MSACWFLDEYLVCLPWRHARYECKNSQIPVIQRANQWMAVGATNNTTAKDFRHPSWEFGSGTSRASVVIPRCLPKSYPVATTLTMAAHRLLGRFGRGSHHHIGP